MIMSTRGKGRVLDDSSSGWSKELRICESCWRHLPCQSSANSRRNLSWFKFNASAREIPGENGLELIHLQRKYTSCKILVILTIEWINNETNLVSPVHSQGEISDLPHRPFVHPPTGHKYLPPPSKLHL